MSIDKLQEKIRKMKNPSIVDFSVDLKQIPPHILAQEHNEILAYDRFCRELLDGLKGMVPAVRFNMGHFSLLGGWPVPYEQNDGICKSTGLLCPDRHAGMPFQTGCGMVGQMSFCGQLHLAV